MSCTHNWHKGMEAKRKGKNQAFKTCTACGVFEYITMDQYYKFEDIILEEKIKRIVKEILNELKP